jgi:hypothetical protein
MPNKIKVALLVAAGCVAWYLLTLLRRGRQHVAQRTREAQVLKLEQDIPATESIFVNLASYRDPECAQTLHSLFTNAACPTRIWVGLLDQRYAYEASPLEEYAKLTRRDGTYNYSNQIRRYTLSPNKSRGHIPARYLIDKFLCRNEKYHLTVDSHTMFAKNWDLSMCNELDALISSDCPHPVLTMEPPLYTVTSRSQTTTLLQNEPGHFSSSCSKVPLQRGYYLPETRSTTLQHIPDAPVPNLFWSGAFSFTRTRTKRRVPFDPYLSYVHSGENVYMSARWFTHGCDLFTPTRAYVSTMRDSVYHYTVFDNFTALQHKQRRFAYHRMHLILGIGLLNLPSRTRRARYNNALLTKNVKALGLGSVRSLEDWFVRVGLEWQIMDLCKISRLAKLGVSHRADYAEMMAKHGVISMAFVDS